MVSGSYTGGISFFKGLGKGKFAAAKKITTKDGKPLSAEYAQSPCLGDWDGDGDWDMVLGFIQGPVKLYTNNGDLTFTEAGELKIDGKPILSPDGGPCIVDWDADGKLDLLLGDDTGNVSFYKGKGDGSLDLLVDKENAFVIPMQKQTDAWNPRKLDPKSPVGFSPAKPGARTKPFAADWNGDGKLDLLVGDYIQIAGPAKKLTAAQQKELAVLKKQQGAAMVAMNKESQRLSNAAMKEAGIASFNTQPNQEQMKKYSAAWSKLAAGDKKYRAASKTWSDLYAKLAKLEPRPEGTGVVWVYLRK